MFIPFDPLLRFFLSVQQSRVNSKFLQFFHQISILVHLKQDVTASNKLSVEVHLRDRRPVGEDLDPFGKQIDIFPCDSQSKQYYGS